MADDTKLFLNSKQDIINALKIVENYGKLSGLKLNKSKTEATWIGRNILNTVQIKQRIYLGQVNQSRHQVYTSETIQKKQNTQIGAQKFNNAVNLHKNGQKDN